ncbi:MAG: hypothetical protein ACQEVA_09810 [Myxococcota bacterium]
MADDKQKSTHSEDKSEDAGGLEETTGQIEDDATRQITGDALKQIRESASHDMAPEWLEKMRARKQEAEEREDQDFDTPVPQATNSDGTPKTAQMDPDEVGSLTEGMGVPTEDSVPGLRDAPPDSDTTEIERDATKAIDRGELDTLMKEREAEVGQEDSNVTSERPTPGAGVISKTSRTQSDRPTRDVDDDAAAAVEEVDREESSLSSSSFSLPKPGGKSQQDPDTRPLDDGLDEDSFGDFSDEDLHAVVFGDDEADETDAPQPRAPVDEQSPSERVAEESPALDFSDISTEHEVAEPADEAQSEEPAASKEPPAREQIAPPHDEAAPPDVSVPDEAAEPPEPSASDEAAAAPSASDEDVEADFPEDFPDYDSEPTRPVIAATAGFFAALAWIVGGALSMFTSIPSPWESLVPPLALGAGIVTFLLVLVGPPKWVEASILALLGIGIGGFAFLQWSTLGSISVTDVLGMAPLVGAGLALIAAVVTLIRPSGHVEEL